MEAYLRIMRDVLERGDPRQDRTGVGTVALLGTQLRHDLRSGFPAVTTKALGFAQVKAELACFLRGYDRLAQFHGMGCKIWDANAHAPYWKPRARFPGDLGRVYGVQWRRWRKANGLSGLETEVDQLREAVRLLREDPANRRICVSAWNPGELDEMCLPPCHLYFQFFVGGGRHLDTFVVMRSVDTFIGMPFDVASYALLAHIVAQEAGLEPRELVMNFADTHVYRNHFEQCREQLARDPMPLPRLRLDASAGIDTFLPAMAELVGYKHHPAIRGEMNV